MSKENLQNSQLGKNSHLSETYAPEILFRLARAENRARYRINDNILPFWGVDVWNCYEFSCLTDNGLPVSFVLKLIVPCESKFLVESKSLKLYLNSLNFTELGKTASECTKNAEKIIKADLEKLLECEIDAKLFDSEAEKLIPFQQKYLGKTVFEDLVTLTKKETVLENIDFQHFTENPQLLAGTKTDEKRQYAFYTDILRSNCPVTNQPDWGDLYVYMNADYDIDFASMLQYLVSFRKENHFHEEVVEMIFKRLTDKFCPEELMVAAMYARRGGIDINPIRTTEKELIDEAFTSTKALLAKTWRQ
jgi:7-cyano-7-deazaguanine reductase